MFYLALARSRDALLLTTDAALKKEAARQGVRVA
jgi:rRNA-processing protein FCF1